MPPLTSTGNKFVDTEDLVNMLLTANAQCKNLPQNKTPIQKYSPSVATYFPH